MLYTVYTNGVFYEDTYCLETLLHYIRNCDYLSIRIESKDKRPDFVTKFIKNVFDIDLKWCGDSSKILEELTKPNMTIIAALRIYKDWESFFPADAPDDFSKDEMIKYIINDMLTHCISSYSNIVAFSRRGLIAEYLYRKEEYDKLFEIACSHCSGIFTAMENHAIHPHIFPDIVNKYGDPEKLKLLKGISYNE